MLLIRATEAKRILDESPFKKYEKNRKENTSEVFNAILGQRKVKIHEANQIANHYIKTFPFFTSIYSYNRLDLALALNHHYADILPDNINELSDLSLTVEQASTIVDRLFKDYNPEAIPQDLESKSKGVTGEFVRYDGKSATFFTYIEGKRSAQYLALGFDSYYESERFHLLEQLIAQQKTAQIASRKATEHDPIDTLSVTLPNRVEADSQSITDVNTSIVEPAQDTPQADIHYQEVEVYEDDYEENYESQSDEYGFEDNGGVEVKSQSKNNGFEDGSDVELMDSDDEDWLSQVD